MNIDSNALKTPEKLESSKTKLIIDKRFIYDLKQEYLNIQNSMYPLY